MHIAPVPLVRGGGLVMSEGEPLDHGEHGQNHREGVRRGEGEQCLVYERAYTACRGAGKTYHVLFFLPVLTRARFVCAIFPQLVQSQPDNPRGTANLGRRLHDIVGSFSALWHFKWTLVQ